MSDTVLVKLDVAQTALAECKTVMEAKQIADIAEAARVYLMRTNASVETVNRAAEVRTLAERQMGEFLKEMPKNEGGNPKLTGSRAAPVEPTLAEIGITKKQSANAQKLAGIEQREFEKRVAELKSSGTAPTPGRVLSVETKRRPSNQFSLGLLQRQARSTITIWLRSCPKDLREQAVEILEELPGIVFRQMREES